MTTLITNAANRASAQLTEYGFESMCLFNGNHYGCSSTGLAKICCGGSDDSGEIDASFTTAMTDLGISNPKRMFCLYTGYEADGDLQVKDYASEALVGTYDIPAGTSLQQRHMVKLGEGAYGRYWHYKFSNVDGADFSIDSVEIVTIPLGHNHG